MDGSIRIHEVASGKEISVFYGHVDPILTLAVSPSGKWISGMSVEGQVKVWRTKDGFVPELGPDPAPIEIKRIKVGE